MGVPADSDRIAIRGFHSVQRVAQSYLGSLWIVLDQRQGEPGKPLLLRRLQLPADTPSEARQHIAHAGRAAVGLLHTNLLPPIEVIEEGEEIVVLHDQTEAEPLRSLQSWANLRGLTFPAGVSLKILSDLLEGLTALHAGAASSGISPFGGLSPDSVLVARTGDACLCDPLVASCAALLEGVGFNTAKLGYAAPEQVHAVAPLTPASDVFACGAMLWELLAARRLLSGSRATIERKLLEHNLPSLTTSLRSDQKVSSGLLELVERCLAADASKRPSTPAALLEELKRCGQEIATREQVAQFVSKLSGQRLDRRSAAVRSKSIPELEVPPEVVGSGQSSRRAAAAPSAPGSDAQTERGSEPAASSSFSSARVASPAPKQPSATFSMPRPQERAAAAGLSRTMIGTGTPASPSLPGASARSAKRPAVLAPAVQEAAPAPPEQPKPIAAQAKPAKPEPPPAAETREATPPASARKPTPSYIEPPPIPESVRIEEDEENDATIREQPPEDWMHAAPAPVAAAAAPKPSAAPSAAPAVPIVPQVAGRRTVAGVGVPPHPALAATLPFTNITPGAFAAAQPAAAPQPGLLQSVTPQPSTQPTLTTTAQPGLFEPGMPQPSTLPSMAAASTGAPPVSVVSSGPAGPGGPSSQTYVSPPPSSARPSSRAIGGSMSPGSRSLPPGIPSLKGYEPTFAMAPEELVPRVSPSARVVRPRSGWESALGRGGSRLNRTLFAGAAACVALASAIVIVLFLRRPAPSATLELDNAAAVGREPAPEAAQPAADQHDAPTPTAAPAPAAADDDEERSADAQGASPEAAENAAPAGNASPQLDDRQLSQLFALEHYEPWPSCPERGSASKAKAKKSAARGAKDAKEAARLLKAARAELLRGNNEKAQSLLCRATTHDPSNSQAQQALAELALRFGNGAQAQASIQRALARKPEDPTLLGIQGDALVLAGDLPGSRRVWLRANPSPGTDEERMRSLAGTYRKLGDRLLGSSSYAAACALFRRSLVLSSCGSSPQPECKGSYAPGIGLAESLRRLQQPRAALAWAERAANAFPKDARVQLLLGDILFDNGQKQEAKNAWAAARKAQPSNVLAAQRLAKGKP